MRVKFAGRTVEVHANVIGLSSQEDTLEKLVTSIENFHDNVLRAILLTSPIICVPIEVPG